MIRSTRTTAAATICAGLLAGGAAAALAQDGTTSTPAAQEIKLTIPAKGLHFQFVDTKPKGESSGDYDIDYGKVVDAATGAARGYIVQNCVLGKLGKTHLAACDGNIDLGSGTVYFGAGGVDKDGPTDIAITGGTGDYAGANGTIVIQQGRKNFSVDVRLQP